MLINNPRRRRRSSTTSRTSLSNEQKKMTGWTGCRPAKIRLKIPRQKNNDRPEKKVRKEKNQEHGTFLDRFCLGRWTDETAFRWGLTPPCNIDCLEGKDKNQGHCNSHSIREAVQRGIGVRGEHNWMNFLHSTGGTGGGRRKLTSQYIEQAPGFLAFGGFAFMKAKYIAILIAHSMGKYFGMSGRSPSLQH